MHKNSLKEKFTNLSSAVADIYQESAEKQQVPGYCYAIVENGLPVEVGAHGLANIDAKIAVNDNTVFRIASLTKSFTALSVLNLRDEKMLSLETDVKEIVPEFHSRGLTSDSPEVTIRDLLQHSGGLPQDDPWGDRLLAMSEKDFLTFLRGGVSFSTPVATKFEYSNLGYALLGLIVSRVSGMSYQEFVRERIWQELGMSDAYWDYVEVPEDTLACGYRYVNGGWQKQELLRDGSFAAMGGMLVSMRDYVKYMSAHMSAWPARDGAEGVLAKRSTLRSMHQMAQRIENGENVKLFSGKELSLRRGYGFGLMCAVDQDQRQYVYHSGSLPGFGALWMMMPEFNLGLAIFSNVSYGRFWDAHLSVADMLVSGAELAPRNEEPSKILLERKKALVGLLPDFQFGEDVFAANFFKDKPLPERRKEANELFQSAGKIGAASALVAENALRGSFVLEGKAASVRVRFTLSPELNPKIQFLELNSF